ncbi:MAG: cation:proton antiporter [Eubacterium sp.]|nr:cation:proton antiporter [Eubacterium sp.]
MGYEFLLWLAIILFSTKVVGLIIRKIGLPEVVGFLIAGIVLGPSVLKIITISPGDPTGMFLENTAELGVILLMFAAGLETDMQQMKANLKASVVTAVCGVVVPLVVGTIVYGVYFGKNFGDYDSLLESIFVGVVLTATSVSITVQTLREMGHLNGAVGTTILGAAVIDDILGIIVLAVVSGLKDTSVSIGSVLLKLLGFAVVIVVIFIVVRKLEPILALDKGKRRTGLFALAFCMILAFVSERFFGVADITGAYFAGFILSGSTVKGYVGEKVENVSTMFFSSVFFASIGIKVTLGGMSASVWIFAIILTVVAILTKVIGCGGGAAMCGFRGKSVLQIGVGMVSRGEVALIVAEKGRQLGLVDEAMFAPVVLVVIVTTLLTPILLKFVFTKELKALKEMKKRLKAENQRIKEKVGKA